MNEIFKRISVRKYEDKPVEQEKIEACSQSFCRSNGNSGCSAWYWRWASRFCTCSSRLSSGRETATS